MLFFSFSPQCHPSRASGTNRVMTSPSEKLSKVLLSPAAWEKTAWTRVRPFFSSPTAMELDRGRVRVSGTEEILLYLKHIYIFFNKQGVNSWTFLHVSLQLYCTLLLDMSLTRSNGLMTKSRGCLHTSILLDHRTSAMQSQVFKQITKPNQVTQGLLYIVPALSI